MHREEGWMCGSGDESSQSEPNEGWDVLQYKVFLLMIRPGATSCQESSCFPDKRTKMDVPHQSATAHTSFATGAQTRKKYHLMSGIIGTVQDSIEGAGICEEFSSLFCMRIGFVDGDSDAGIEPEDAGFGEEHEVSGWFRSEFEKGTNQGICNARKET